MAVMLGTVQKVQLVSEMESHVKGGAGGWSPRKCIPLQGRHHKSPTLSGIKFAKPYWHKIWAQIHTLTGTNSQRVPFLAQLLLKSG